MDPEAHAEPDSDSANLSSDEEKRKPLLDAAGMERPEFVLGFPQDPELDRLVAAFEAGNYAFVRREAPELAKRTSDAAVRAASLELRRRIEPDPLAMYLLLISVLLLVFLIVWAYGVHNR